MAHMRGILSQARILLQWIGMLFFAALALFLLVATGLAIVGVWPWPEVALRWNGAEVAQAGVWLQLILTVLAVTLCVFLPTNQRVLRLENTHRKFEIDMSDVTRAYAAAHAADRTGLFQLADTFEQMRERMTFLRQHPDFADLEPEILEVAAKMSFESRALAERYSDARVSRARGFLEQRQHELEQFNGRIEHAKAINAEFKTWLHRLDLEETVAATHMERLLEELERVLPELNLTEPFDKRGTVTILPKRAE